MCSSDLVGTAQRAQSYPLPTDLAQASVKVAGVAVPMIQASPTGVLFQTPTELLSGPTSVTVSANGYTSPTLPVEVRPVNPGIFAAAHTNGNLVTSVSPAQSGELLVIWATGLGRAKSDDASGKPASANPLVELRDPVTVTIGGASSDVVFAGLAPGYAGLQIVLVKVPAVSGTSGTSNLVLTSGGEPGAAYNLPVR